MLMSEGLLFSECGKALASRTRVAHQTVDKAAGVAAPTAARLSAQGDSLKATRHNLVNDTRKYVSAHPVKSLGACLT